MSEQADRLIAAALRDHTRVAAPEHLHRRLEKRYLPTRRRGWMLPTFTAFAGAALAVAAMLIVRPSSSSSTDPAMEAMGDHLRLIGDHGLGVQANDMHNVKPWFTGKLDFVPPISFLGDEDFQLRGGDVAVFLGHKCAAFEFARRLHTISLFIYESAAAASSGERTIQGFHVLTWQRGGFGYALVSDINWDELHTLAARVQQ